MNEPKFTPGEWGIRTPPNVSKHLKACQRILAGDKVEEGTGTVVCIMGGTTEASKANALLIAQSKKMYEALRMIVDADEPWCMDDLREVLAKVEGEEVEP